ncbi:MAG TPA: hypothetical protein VFH94_02500 [Streptomyces sp.]|nr:hypothetical protein [Streptomyces sp.]
MRRWWARVGAPVVLGSAAGAAATLITDRSWGWDLVARCVVFSLTYVLLRPAVERSRRRAEVRDARHMREIRQARRDRDG